MKKLIIILVIFFNSLFAAQVQELPWPRGETFLTFLEKYSIPQKLYFDLEKEDKELCSEIVADKRYYLYTNDDGTLNQVLIPVSEDIQLHLYKDSHGSFRFQTLPINYNEFTETITVTVNSSLSNDIQKATGDVTLAVMIKSIFKDVNFRQMQKGDKVVIKYSQKSLLGRPHGLPIIHGAMVEAGRNKYYRFRNDKDDKFYNEKGIGFTKTYFFKIPLTYSRISSQFTKKRWHPVLKRYRAHLGTDFAAPRGRKIYAAGNGKVIFAGRKGGYGKTIIISHGNGYKTLYAHQNGFAKGMRSGKRVKKGQHIGYVGSTGLSSGPHLHLGLYKNGRAVNPLKVIRKAETKGLKGKAKQTFIANAKILINKFNEKLVDVNETVATKLNRTTDKSDINLL